MEMRQADQKQASRGRDTNNFRRLKQYRGGSWELRAEIAGEASCLAPTWRATYTFNPTREFCQQPVTWSGVNILLHALVEALYGAQHFNISAGCCHEVDDDTSSRVTWGNGGGDATEGIRTDSYEWAEEWNKPVRVFFNSLW